MAEKLSYHIKKLKYLWKDNKLLFFKQLYRSTKGALTSPMRRVQEDTEEHIFNHIIKGEKEIIHTIEYPNGNTSKIILPVEDKGLTKELLLHGTREPTELNLFINVIKSKGNPNIIDIGANLGLFALLEPHLTDGKITAIEPNPKTFSYLKRSVKLNNFQKDMKLLNIGISNAQGKIPFYISNKFNWSRFVKGNPRDLVSTKQIKVNTIDNLFKNKKVDLVRMDVEGYETKVLDGMKETIKKNKDITIFMEYHADLFSTKQREKFIKWLDKNKLYIRYSFSSAKRKVVGIDMEMNPDKLRNSDDNYCLVLERKISWKHGK